MPELFSVRVIGVQQAQAMMDKLGMAAMAAVRDKLVVGSVLPYSAAIETGSFRGGRLARRAGGVFYMARAAAQVVSRAQPKIAAALLSGNVSDASRILLDIAAQVKTIAQSLVVVKSGALRESIRVTLASGSGNGGFNR